MPMIASSCRYCGEQQFQTLSLATCYMLMTYASLAYPLQVFGATEIIMKQKVVYIKSFCTNMYCCPLWFNSTSSSVKKLKRSYNSVLRRLL